jgi:hypothetical protein
MTAVKGIPYTLTSGGSWVSRGRAALSAFDNFVLGTTKPSASNTGVPSAITLTTVNGDIVVTTDGAIIENKDVFGFIRVQAPNVTIRNCKIRGRDTGNAYVVSGVTLPCTPNGNPVGDGAYARLWPTWYGLIDGNHASATNMLVERCTLVCDWPSWWGFAISLHDSTIHRCDISNFPDGVEDYGNNIITGNYIHDPVFHASDYNQRNSTPPWWSHNDGIMATGSRNGNSRYEGNYIYMLNTGAHIQYQDAQGYGDHRWGAGITLAPNNGPINNMVIKNNWLSSGAAGFQCNGTNTALGHAGASNVIGEVSGNRVAHNMHDYGNNSTYQLRWAVGVGVTNYVGTNVWDDDQSVIDWDPSKVGQALTVGFTGGIRIP